MYAADSSRAAIGAALGRSVNAVDARRHALGLERRTPLGGGWSVREDALVTAATRERIPARVIAQALGRSREAVLSRRRRLGLCRSPAPRWSVDEQAALEAAYRDGDGLTAIASRLGRSEDAVRLRARQFGLAAARRQRRWRPIDDERLRDGYGRGLSYAEIAEQLLHERTVGAIGARAKALGLTNGARRWRHGDDQQLQAQLTTGDSILSIASRLCRTPEAIRLRAQTLGIARQPTPRTRHRRWTPAEEALLRTHAGLDPGQLGQMLGRSDIAVQGRMRALGLRPNRSPHWHFELVGELTPAERRLIEDAYQEGNGRVLVSLGDRLGRTPGEIKRIATEGRQAPGTATQR